MNRKSIVSLINKYKEDVERNDYKRVILAVFLEGGEYGLNDLKNTISVAGLDLRDYNRASVALIRTLFATIELDNI